ncbi:MAG: metallophosphoesterase family protein [bacterium]|nr:metallophosphoesterase family protein [bacterium]
MPILRVAVISDVHGNRWALEAVLEDIDKKGVDCIVNLGDSLYGPLDPAGTADLLIERDILSISGNEDRALIEEPLDLDSHQSLDFTFKELNSLHLKWLRDMPFSTVVDEKIYLCHGTPDSDCVYMLEKVTANGVKVKTGRDIAKTISVVEQTIVCCGHTHIPRTLYLEDCTYVINPGSVGLQAYTDVLPHDHVMECGNPLAKYAIVTTGNNSDLIKQIEHIEVVYDWSRASKAAKINGREDWSQWLITGSNQP